MSDARDRRPGPGLKVMRAAGAHRGIRARVEQLERRAMLSSAVTPVVRPLMGFSLAGTTVQNRGAEKVAAVYAAVDGLGVASRAGAGVAVAAKAVSSFKVNWDAMRGVLAGAPMEFTPTAADEAVILSVPTPDGSLSRFKVVQTSMMEAELAAKYPDVKTYRGVGIDDRSASLRLDFTPLGLHAQVLSANGSYYVDPYFRNDAAAAHVSYYKRDTVKSAAVEAFTCDVIATDDQQISARTEAMLDGFFADTTTAAEAAGPELTFSGQLRTYRAAVAATGEYTIAVGGGTVPGGQAAIVTAMNRVNGIYETELGIRMTLVANNSLLVYTSGSGDPYTNQNGSTMLTQNINNLSNVIGNANFDIGHVFSTGGGGVAYLGVVGRANKAGGVTGNPSPTGDSFWVDYVAHEMGHQFAGNHTFNGSSNQRNSGTAYEPGSGSTIMAYAGIMGAEDLQPNSDPYFHSASLDEIRNYVTLTIPAVGVITNTGNNAPVVSAGPSYTIPTGTPFILTATGSDPDGDAITYDWQQRDLGAVLTLAAADNGASPIIRAWSPSSSPSRTVPRLSNLLNNTVAKGEELPTSARASFKWRVIARDNKPGGGALSTSDVTLAVVNTGAAFTVTAPNTAVTWAGSSTQTVTWNVAGTTGSGINTANVKISLSTDGGNTWPHVLAASTPNDGGQAITLPAIPATSAARVKVEAVGNIFFDLSNANFSITAAPPMQTAAPGTPVLQAGSDTGTSDGDRITKLNNASESKLWFDVPNTVNGAAVTLFSGTTLIGTGTGNGGTIPLQTNGSGAIVDGTYLITAKQQLAGQTLSNASSGIFVLFDATAPIVTSPGNQAFEATDSAGTPIAFAPATISDNQDATPTLVHAPLPESLFPIGTTTVTATGTDFAGNTASTSFDVTVNDPAWLRRESGGAYHFTGTLGNETLHVTAGRVVLTAGADAARAGIGISVEGGTAALEASQTFSSLSVTGGSSLFDLATHPVAINYTGLSPLGTSDGSAYSGLSGLVAAGRVAAGGPAIISTTADNALTAVAPADAGAVLDFDSEATQLWHGQTVDATTVLLKYTYLGDANLDGLLSGDDYAAIDFNLPIAGSDGYSNGDFNLDGIISGDDYAAIDFNIVAQGAPL